MEEIITKDMNRFIRAVDKKGGKIYAVRDFALAEALRRFGHDSLSDNLDLEVYGISPKDFDSIVKDIFPGSKKYKGNYYLDGVGVSLPLSGMRDSSMDKALSLDSLFLDMVSGTMEDHFEGLMDIQQGIISWTNDNVFKGNISNIFRSIQLASQLGFRLDDDILDCPMDFSLKDFDKDFVFSFWKDMLLNSPTPSIGLEYMKKLRILEVAHIEINNLVGVGQNPDWHQEGDAWTHTKMVVDAGARICRMENLDEEDGLVLMLACLCHDLGKPIATKLIDGKLRAKGHDKEGELPTKYFLDNIGTPKSVIKKVIPLVTEHMFTHDNSFTPERVTSLAKRISPAKIRELVYLAEADCQGMVNCQKDNNARNDLLSLARSLGLD